MNLCVSKAIRFMIAVLFLSLVGIYFRTYSLRSISPGNANQMAYAMVYDKIKSQMRQQLNLHNSLTEEEKDKLADDKAKETLRLEGEKFQETVKQTAQGILKQVRPGHQSRYYLLESDPYYYYALFQEIQKTGQISNRFKKGKFFYPLRQAPRGSWAPITLHPYLGYGWYRLFTFFNKNAGSMEVLSYFPLVLMVPIVILFLMVCSLLEIRFSSAMLGGLFLVLSTAFINRSSFGWFDTDPYQYLFPLMILGLFLKSLSIEGKKKNIFIGLAGLITGIYPFFWEGWPYIFGILLAGSLMAGFLAFACRFKTWVSIAVTGLKYVCFACFFGMIFMTPTGFWYGLVHGLNVLPQFAQSETSLWPNAFLTVGEAKPISFRKALYESGNLIIFYFALLGLFSFLITSIQRRQYHFYLKSFIFALWFFSSLFLALKVERFVVLFALPLAIFASIGLDQMRMMSEQVFKMKKVWSFLIFAFISIPFPLIFAHGTAQNSPLIMNDAWYDVLTVVDQKTPKDAVVNSWWPPGYFIISIAHRKVLADGGSQHLPETYWLAKAYMSSDEREALGILRMLDVSGNEGMRHLRSLGFSLDDASRLILGSVSKDRNQAFFDLSNQLSEDHRKRFLDLTHGIKLPSAYFLVYNDMIEQNLALSVMSNWDFKKSQEIYQSSQKRKVQLPLKWKGMAKRIVFAGLSGKKLTLTDPALMWASSQTQDFIRLLVRHYDKPFSNASVLDDMLKIIGNVWKYTSESPLAKREGNVLIFGNGLRVNLETMDAIVLQENGTPFGFPQSLFWMQNGQLIEKPFSKPILDVSALIFEREGVYWSVLANRNLIRSMLFRLYYLGGEGLRYFKLFTKQFDAANNTRLFIYEINWN